MDQKLKKYPDEPHPDSEHAWKAWWVRKCFRKEDPIPADRWDWIHRCWLETKARWCLLIVLLACNAQASLKDYDWQEQVVAAVLMGEAWSEGEQGMTAVAEVIYQRSFESGKRPIDVVRKRSAFSCLNKTSTTSLVRKYSRYSDYHTALKIAALVCDDPKQLPGITKQANHFTRTNERPYWARGNKPVAVVGAHAFYRIKN